MTNSKTVKLPSIQIVGFYLTLLFSATGIAQKTDLKLQYDKSAELWVEALPVGNGRLGGMIYGNPDVETIQLNENTLWAGQPTATTIHKPWKLYLKLANSFLITNMPKLRI